MSDILDDAVERLEWDERKEEDTPGQALAAADSPYRAERWCSWYRGDDPRGVRRQ